QTADGRRHPAILIAMIVDTAELADFPANGHTFEDFIFEDEIAGVAALGEEEVFVERFGTDGVVEDIVLDISEREIALGDGGEIFDPVGDGELFGNELFGHGRPPIRKYNARGGGKGG